MPFTKGSPDINRKGRPRKGQTMTDILANVLQEKSVNYRDKQITGKEAAARKLLELAMSGDVPALRYLIDRMDGPPKQALEISGGISVAIAPLDESL